MSDATAPNRSDDASPHRAVDDVGESSSRLDWAAASRWLVIVLTITALAAIYHRPMARTVRRSLASHHADSASELLRAGHASEALAAVDRALYWLPNDAALVYLRAQIHAAADDLEASLVDYTKVTNELAPNFATAYAKRAEVHRQTANFADAIRDLDRAIELSPSGAGLLKDRAYLKALAETDLDEALEEIEHAIDLFVRQSHQQGQRHHLPAEFIDTRGYVRYRLGQHEQALDDIERALRTLEVERDRVLKEMTRAKVSPGELMRSFDKVQAEITYHRGLIRQAQGEAGLAEEDFALAKDLGYKPPAPEAFRAADSN